jgi:hypothetical protein
MIVSNLVRNITYMCLSDCSLNIKLLLFKDYLISSVQDFFNISENDYCSNKYIIVTSTKVLGTVLVFILYQIVFYKLLDFLLYSVFKYEKPIKENLEDSLDSLYDSDEESEVMEQLPVQPGPENQLFDVDSEKSEGSEDSDGSEEVNSRVSEGSGGSEESSDSIKFSLKLRKRNIINYKE